MRKTQFIMIALAIIVIVTGWIVLNTDKVYAGPGPCNILWICNKSTCSDKCTYEGQLYWVLSFDVCPGRTPPPYLEWCIQK
jgi:hypothetical protein